LWLILYFAVEWGYYVLFEVLWNGQSPGKRVFRLRVVKVAGHPVGFFDSVLRNLLRAADAFPLFPSGISGIGCYGFGAISMLFSPRFQRLGDLAARTVVILERQSWYGRRMPGQQTAATLAGDAMLRGMRLSNRERRMLAEFVDRRHRLHPARCDELAEILANRYAKRLGHPPPANPTDYLVKLYESAAQQGDR
jgi:hypothetical protein